MSYTIVIAALVALDTAMILETVAMNCGRRVRRHTRVGQDAILKNVRAAPPLFMWWNVGWCFLLVVGMEVVQNKRLIAVTSTGRTHPTRALRSASNDR